MHHSLEVADIFRQAGSQWRHDHLGHLSLNQLKVMSAIERCRSAEMGGHRLACTSCGQIQIAYNSCRNRHCPKCQASAAKRWLEARQADLLPVPYYHVVFTLPEPIRSMAYQNKAVIYNLLFQAASEALRTIAKDPKHLGAQIGMTMVLHTWGSALIHHPHVHCVVPGGGFSADGQHWIACKSGFFLPVTVLSRVFRRLFLDKLRAAKQAGLLEFYGQQQDLNDTRYFEMVCDPLRHIGWVIYTKPPFAGPAAVLAYLSRYTHRVAIANSRLLHFDDQGVTFKWKDYRQHGPTKHKTMTLNTSEFIRRFLLHVLPRGFHRIRHYGFFANTVKEQKLVLVRRLLAIPAPIIIESENQRPTFHCPVCSAPMVIIETLPPVYQPRAPPLALAS